jgi:hypothetical protein
MSQSSSSQQPTKVALGSWKSRVGKGLFLFSSFLLSGLLFLNQGFLSVFSPFPLLFFAAKARWSWTLLATLTNALVIAGVALSVPGLERLAFFGLAYLVVVGGMVAGLKVAMMGSLPQSSPFDPEFWAVEVGPSPEPIDPVEASEEQRAERAARAQRVSLYGAALPLLGMVALAVGFWMFVDQPLEMVRTEVEAVLSERLKDLPQGPDVPSLTDLVDTVVAIFPAVVLFLPLLYLAVNLILWLRSVPPRMHAQMNVFPKDFLLWKLPDTAVWGLISVGLLTWAGSELQRPEVVLIGSSLVRLFVFLYGLQGLSVVAFGMAKVQFGGFLRSLVLIFSAMVVIRAAVLPFQLGSVWTMVMTGWIPLLGLFDLWIDFRSKMRQSN